MAEVKTFISYASRTGLIVRDGLASCLRLMQLAYLGRVLVGLGNIEFEVMD